MFISLSLLSVRLSHHHHHSYYYSIRQIAVEDMVLSGACIMPHGAMILDLNMDGIPDGCRLLHQACVDTASSLLSTNPETIIIFTPHGISLSKTIGVCINESVSGSATWSGEWEDYRVCATCDLEVAHSLIKHLDEDNIAAEGIISTAASMTAPIAWGEVVPLHFLTREAGATNIFQVVVVSWPQTRFDPVNHSQAFMDIGESIQKFCRTKSSKRIGLVFSCDMSHMHGTVAGTRLIFSGSDSFGQDADIAIRFDSAIVEWIKHLAMGDIIRSREILMVRAMDVVERAKACGWAGFCALQGCMEEAMAVDKTPRSHKNKLDCWRGFFHGYAAPTYYGMMAASFVRVNVTPAAEEQEI
jgi:aromatic ring-opening dioxygenase LigB subunit